MWSVPSLNSQLRLFSPLVFSERVVLFYDDGNATVLINTLDVSTGTFLYSTTVADFDYYDGMFFGIDETYFVTNSEYFEEMRLFSAESGVARWEFPLPAWRTLANNSLVAVASSCTCPFDGCNSSNCPPSGGVIYGLSTDTGAVNWTSQVPAPGLPNLIPYVALPGVPISQSSLFVAPAGGLFASGYEALYVDSASSKLFMSFDITGTLISQLNLTVANDGENLNPNPLCTSADGTVLFYHFVDPVTFSSSFVAAALPGTGTPTFSPALGSRGSRGSRRR